MKNIIYLVIDAFCYNNLKRKIGNEYVTPFLRSLISKSIVSNKLYSQAPYTEASLVTILSGENTLEEGGYILGNKKVKTTIFERARCEGYKTISQYSPYVYSKSYLRGVDKFYYTRLYSIEPLFDYRLKYFKDKYIKNKITNMEFEICKILIEEAFETWIEQLEAIKRSDITAKLIINWISQNLILELHNELCNEKIKFLSLGNEYIKSIFDNFDSCNLKKLSKIYNTQLKLPHCEKLINMYQSKLEEYQKKYSNIVKYQKLPIKYLLSTLLSGNDGFKNFKGLIHNYYKHYRNDYLKNYLYKINNNAKVEANFRRQIEYIQYLISVEKTEKPLFIYMHVQDFHLPSVFHSVESDNLELLCNEMNEAFSLLDKIDNNYRGNIIADLSARYCDNLIKYFYNILNNLFGNDFVFLVTADHGFPSYECPPRPIIYNQTYSEAFHIPLVCYSQNEEAKELDGFISNMDIFPILLKSAGKTNEDYPLYRKYILSEYGGPGCPDISQKHIWYTYIDDKWRISFECLLNDNIDYSKIKSIYNINKDKDELYNIVKREIKNIEINKIIDIVQKRHIILRNKYSGNLFWKYIIKD